VGSLFADQLGIGDDPGFGTQQTTGAVIGVVVSAAGLYLMRRARTGGAPTP
jgi:hypothetical protein